MLWDQFCLVEVWIWGGRSISLAQVVLEHGSAQLFEQYRPVLETVLALLPPNSTVTLLADRGFEHGELMRCCKATVGLGYSGEVRSASDLIDGHEPECGTTVATLGAAYLFQCHRVRRYYLPPG